MLSLTSLVVIRLQQVLRPAGMLNLTSIFFETHRLSFCSVV